MFFINRETLAGTPENQRVAKLTGLLWAKTGDRRLRIARLETIRTSENEFQGYMAFARR